MWRLRNAETMQSKGSEDTDSANRPTTDNLDDLNQIIHSQISTFLAKYAHSPIEHDEVNFDDLISKSIQIYGVPYACSLDRRQKGEGLQR